MARIYNSTDGPLIIDRAGRVLDARTWSPEGADVDVDASPVAGHIAAGRVIVDAGEAEPTHAPPTEAGDPDVADPQPSKRARKGGASTATPQEG